MDSFKWWLKYAIISGGKKWPYIIHFFRSQNQLCNDGEPPILKEPKKMTNDEALFELNILRLWKIIYTNGNEQDDFEFILKCKSLGLEYDFNFLCTDDFKLWKCLKSPTI